MFLSIIIFNWKTLRIVDSEEMASRKKREFLETFSLFSQMYICIIFIGKGLLFSSHRSVYIKMNDVYGSVSKKMFYLIFHERHERRI